jgi:hypothetical protein
MKNKNLIFIGILMVLVLGVGAAVYFISISKNSQTGSQPPNLEEILEFPPASEEAVTDSEEKRESKEEISPSILAKDGFSIDLPPGWQEAATSSGALALVLNVGEEITNEKAKEIGFMTYFSINIDYLRSPSLEEYVKELRDSLQEAIPTIKYLNQWDGEVNGNPAFFLECESKQEEIDFKTLLVFIKSPNGLVWALSFNTLKDKWPEHRDLFYQTANSFQLNLKTAEN